MLSSDVQELGRLLREARERRGATLTDAQQATKIRHLFLQALENEDFSVLPPPFYIRGFIKTYAVYLGLEPRSTVQLFDEMLGNVSAARLYDHNATPSADSGGRGASFPMAGLTQGEARLVEASGESRNLTTLTPQQPEYNTSESRALVVANKRRSNGLYEPEKYVLKPIMLTGAKGPFYMPNFVPLLLVAIVVLAAALLVYRGLSGPVKETPETVAAAATVTAASNLSNGSRLAQATVSGAKASASASSRSGMTPPPYYNPDPPISTAKASSSNDKPATTAASAPALSDAGGTALAAGGSIGGQGGAATTTTPVASTIKVEVTVGTSDPRGSWLTIWVDDEQKVSKMVAPGEVLPLEGRKVAVRAGNPGAITVKVNGEVKPYTKPQAGIITHTWFADGRDIIEQ